MSRVSGGVPGAEVLPLPVSVRTEYAQWSNGAQKEHTVVWAPTSLARNFLWNGVASGTKWKVGEPSVADRRIGTG